MRIKKIVLAVLLIAAPLIYRAVAEDDALKYVENMDKISQAIEGPKNEIMSNLGVSGSSGFSMSRIMCYLVFGAIGFVAFMYGKSQKNLKTLGIGLVLSVYPYFVKDLFWMWVIGIMISLLLFLPQD